MTRAAETSLFEVRLPVEFTGIEGQYRGEEVPAMLSRLLQDSFSQSGTTTVQTLDGRLHSVTQGEAKVIPDLALVCIRASASGSDGPSRASPGKRFFTRASQFRKIAEPGSTNPGANRAISAAVTGFTVVEDEICYPDVKVLCLATDYPVETLKENQKWFVGKTEKPHLGGFVLQDYRGTIPFAYVDARYDLESFGGAVESNLMIGRCQPEGADTAESKLRLSVLLGEFEVAFQTL